MDTQKTSKQLLELYLKKYYEDVATAKAEGRLGWSVAIVPQEFFETMGLKLIMPENHSAVISARKRSIEFLNRAESYGYNKDICGYIRANFGYVLSGAKTDPELPYVPIPDFLICVNNYCTEIIKWYENLAKEMNIPLFMIDMPFNHEYDITKSRINYITDQFKRLIAQLENFTGRSFDYERYNEIMEISRENVNLWKRIINLQGHIPSPMNGFELLNYMTCVVVMRGRKETTEIFECWIKELEERARNGVGPFRDVEEKYRVMWEGIACWPQLAHTAKALKHYGINITGSFYPEGWVIEYDIGNMSSMAKAYTSTCNNINLDRQVELRVKIIRNGRCEGIIYHMNRSCKVATFLQYEIQRRVFAETGIPYITFDGDQADPRVFEPAQFDSRILTLVEMMERRKGVSAQ